MTREEAKEVFLNRGFIDGIYDGNKWREACIVISKWLEQESQTFRWCTTCKEYDQEKHCCHRWSKVIRDTVEEMRQEQEQEPILDKIRAEIEKLRPNLRPEQMTDYDYAMVNVVNDIVAIIDKYKAESEAENGND